MSFQSWHLLTDDLAIRIFDHDHLWLHLLVHLVLVVMPTLLLCMAVLALYRLFWASTKDRSSGQSDNETITFHTIPQQLFSFITRYSSRYQLVLGLGALVTLPVTYAGLELPKQIINYAISAESYQGSPASQNMTQVDYLLILCGLYLFVLLINGIVKYFLNYYKGSLSEKLILQLRLTIFQQKQSCGRQTQQSDIVPVIIQEVEPVCGFSGDALTVPLLQGGTVITIITFMMVQNVALGAAAMTLIPIQLLIIPRFQKRINLLVHQRVGRVRELSKALIIRGEEHAAATEKDTTALFLSLQTLRLKIFKAKYMSKAINNFIMNLTPFFFYTIGGYLVIEGKLSMGALVASLASYKDLASAIREMFTYYQSYQNARIRYSEIYAFVHEE